jgi:hypothetical protein
MMNATGWDDFGQVSRVNKIYEAFLTPAGIISREDGKTVSFEIQL